MHCKPSTNPSVWPAHESSQFDPQALVDEARDLGAAGFESSVIEARGLVLVLFYAHWDYRSVQARRRLIFLDRDRCPEPFDLYMMNADHSLRIANTYKIRTLPTLLIFRGGKLIRSAENTRCVTQIHELLDQVAN